MLIKTLYKRNANKSISQWSIFADGNSYWSEYGVVGGINTKDNPVFVTGTNNGKVNETTDEEQAIKEAESIASIKIKSENFVENIDDVDNLKFQPPMLAHVYDKKYTNDIKFIQRKYDGLRMNTHLENDNVVAISRRNNPFYTVDHIKDALKPILEKYPTIHIDGELYNHEFHNNFNKIVSIIKKKKLTTDDIELCTKYIRYNVYDLWDDANPNMIFSERMTLLHTILDGVPFIDIVETYSVSSQEEIDDYFKRFIQEGYEGAILRKDTPYEHKRSKNLLKYKEFDDDEFEVIDICIGKENTKAEFAWIKLKN